MHDRYYTKLASYTHNPHILTRYFKSSESTREHIEVKSSRPQTPRLLFFHRPSASVGTPFFKQFMDPTPVMVYLFYENKKICILPQFPLIPGTIEEVSKIFFILPQSFLNCCRIQRGLRKDEEN